MASPEQLIKNKLDADKAARPFFRNTVVQVEAFDISLKYKDKPPRLGAITGSSETLKIETRPYKGWTLGHAVTIETNKPAKAGDPVYEPHVKVGGGADFYGICTDIDRQGKQAQIVVKGESLGFSAWLAGKDATIKAGDKLKVNADGQLEKVAGAGAYQFQAKADAVTQDGAFLVHAIYLGNIAGA